MTHDEFAARYELRTRLRAEGVESWEAVRTSTDEPVLVHRLATSMRQRLLEMIDHLEAVMVQLVSLATKQPDLFADRGDWCP